MGRKPKSHPGKPSVHKGQERVWWRGRYYDLGPEGSARARAEYARLVALWAADPNAPAFRADDALVGELCADYLESKDSPREGLQRDRAVLAVELLLEHHVATPVADFGPVLLRAWQDHLCQLPDPRNPGRQRFAVTTVNYHVDTIRRVWAWGVSRQRVGADALTALRAVPRPKVGEARAPKVVDPADPAHVKAMLPFLRPQPRAMVVLQLASGARPGEMIGMTPEQVHRGGVINVAGAGRHDLDKLGVWAYVPTKHKMTWKNKPRVLLFAGEAQAVLTPFLDRGPDVPCFSPKEAAEGLRAEQRAAREARGGGSGGNRKVPKAAAPRRAPKDRYTDNSYRAAITRACEKAGVPAFFPYQLRHLAAAEIQEVFGLDAVQALLGHHTKSMSEHYAGLNVKTAADVAKARGG
ncbi:MAG TPA: tyrosine-type recombinase/integrase [Urbifossiella sp.]|nr:tyrosine-type recombinase/integrase [Urbifossiella sp.]